MVAGGDVDKSKLKEYGKYPVIANALTNEGIVGYYDDYYRIKTPAVTVTGRGDIGHAKARDTNFTPVVRLLTLISKHNSLFLENAINLKRIYSESTGVPQLTAPQLSKYKIGITDIEEEIVIGTFFYKLDKLITLHQRKLEQLEQLKNTLLSKMFPKSGTNIPEIRFSGFTDAWKQRKAKEIFITISEKGHIDLPVLSASQEFGMVER
ncbi:restriction endonuclease subunit S, partial [Enterococcus cecorum]|uniref:restriction endonuclease subunit S n=1 Tax=Enterococcus cecorum TaxID=44008 RepID=UPI003F937E6F